MNTFRLGLLERTSGGRLVFSYDKHWLSRPEAIPLSINLPLREEPYKDDRLLAYLDNLLPDRADVRRRIAETTGAVDASVFELLRVIGRDCVGAIQLRPDGEPAPRREPIAGQPLTSKRIAGILRGLDVAPQGFVNEPFRMSLAGAQEKTAFLKWGNRWWVPHGPTPTTHIFKPAMGKLANGVDLTSSVENEWLCLSLAEALGLPVAQTHMRHFENVSCLVVERFDRRWSKNKRQLDRIAQEDLCQASSVLSAGKYESHGGPGIVSLMRFLDGSDLRDRDREAFIRAQLVYFFLGAIDGHAKNFSIQLTPTGFRLAPFYDVISVWPALAHKQIVWKNMKFAMAVGHSRHYDLRVIQKRHWFETAKQCGFDSRRLTAIFEDLFSRIQGIKKSPLKLPKGFPPRLYDQIVGQLSLQAERFAEP